MSPTILLVAAAPAMAPVTARALDRAGAPIPRRFAAMLAALGVTVVSARWLAGAWPTWWLPVPVSLTVIAVPLALADLRHLRLPDILTLPAYPLLGAAMGAAAFGGGGPSLAARAVAGALLFGGAHALVARMAPGSLGAGDVKLSGSLGMVLGASGWPALALAAVLAALFSLALALAHTGRSRAGARAHRATARHPAATDPHPAEPAADLLPAGPASPAGARHPAAPNSRAVPTRNPAPGRNPAATRRSAPNPHPAADRHLAGPASPAGAQHPAAPAAPSPRAAPTRNPASASRPAPTPRPAAPFSGPRVPHGPALLAATWLCALFPGAP